MIPRNLMRIKASIKPDKQFIAHCISMKTGFNITLNDNMSRYDADIYYGNNCIGIASFEQRCNDSRKYDTILVPVCRLAILNELSDMIGVNSHYAVLYTFNKVIVVYDVHSNLSLEHNSIFTEIDKSEFKVYSIDDICW